MARGDPYNPVFSDIADAATTTFDGSASSTGSAIISEISGNGDAEIRVQHSNDGGSTWTTIAQLEDDAGNLTFAADFHTQFNRIIVSSGTRRIEITNVSGGQAQYEVSGDER
jgi:hypothetical protein